MTARVHAYEARLVVAARTLPLVHPPLPFICLPWSGGLCLAPEATGVSQSHPASLTLAS